MDFSTKEIVNVYSYSNATEDRNWVKEVCINGRTYDKYGTFTATTVVAIQYRVWDPSVERNKYVILMGVARQNPGDTTLVKNIAYETAMENAMINPTVKYIYDTEVSKLNIISLMQVYVDTLPKEFIKTKQELINEGKSLSKYNRSHISDSYYSDYYNDYINIFMSD